MKKENPVLSTLLGNLMKEKQPIWRRTAKELSRPRRQKVEVNLSKLESYAADNSVILVPGKVLGSGNITKQITVAAFSFSNSAKKIITAAGGKTISIDTLVKSNPTGRGILLLK
jgi:large subunit ribosomal protein L18e